MHPSQMHDLYIDYEKQMRAKYLSCIDESAYCSVIHHLEKNHIVRNIIAVVITEAIENLHKRYLKENGNRSKRISRKATAT